MRGGMGHRQTGCDDRVRPHIHDAAAVSPAVPPGISDITLADAGHIPRLAVFHRQSVQMTAIFRRQFAQKGWLPQWNKAVPLAGGRQATKQSVDEDDLTVGIDRYVVNVEVPRDVADLGDVDPVKPIHNLTGLQRIFETPELIQRRHPQRLAVTPQTEAAIEGPLEQRQSAIGLRTDQKELSRLVSRKRQAQLLLCQPGGELG